MKNSQWGKWSLFIVILGMMTALGGCFGGGGSVPTGGVRGKVVAPKGDIKNSKLIIGPPDTQDHDYIPLKGASVTADNTRKAATTDKYGDFTLYDIPVGLRTITASYT
ncbi:MAG: carboxypeptidase-like regulatory domain-containing protein, partial [Firmicutes bacterium]|nr:carboxypeptidase-like regulatory domain-containing protein [Bacillota bacterium]